MSKESNLGKGLLVGFLTGGMVGAAVALLFAPKSGKELRKDIKGKTDELLDEAEKYLDVAKGKANTLINDGKSKSEKIISDAKIKADELIKDAEKVFSEAKEKASGAIASGKETLSQETARLKTAVKAGVDAYKETKNS
jgi:gas vesicle protein